MSQPAISVTAISKRYQIGRAQRRGSYRTLREDFRKLASAPFRWASSRLRGGGGEAFWALRDVSFDVQPGEVVGVIGGNGAGKSTLLKIISRITKPTSGEIRLRGRVGSLLEVGTGFHPELSGRENIYLSGAILGMTRGEVRRKFDEIVDFSGVEKFLDTPAKRYSSGMYTRLGFAVAANLDPEILLIDEVLAVGDVEFQNKCLGKMRSVAKQGRTVLFVSHNMPAVTNLCSRVVWIRGGQMHLSGETRDVVSSYLQTSRESLAVTLSQREDRQGSGHWRYTRAWIGDQHGQPINAAVSGEPVSFFLEFASRGEEARASKILTTIAIRDSHGKILFSLANFLSGHELGSLPEKNVLRCDVPCLPLNGDEYTCDLWLSVNGEHADYVLDAMPLAVASADVFGSGKTPAIHKHGPIFVKHAWHVADDVPPTAN